MKFIWKILGWFFHEDLKWYHDVWHAESRRAFRYELRYSPRRTKYIPEKQIDIWWEGTITFSTRSSSTYTDMVMRHIDHATYMTNGKNVRWWEEEQVENN